MFTHSLLARYGGGPEHAPVGWVPPSKLLKVLQFTNNFRRIHKVVDLPLEIVDSFRFLPNPGWKFIIAINSHHRKLHLERALWWGKRASKFFSFFTIFIILTLLSIPLIMSNIYFVSIILGFFSLLILLTSFTYHILGQVDGLLVHRAGVADQFSGIFECLGGPGVLPAWVGTLLDVPAALNFNNEFEEIRGLIGFDSWVANLNLSDAQLETFNLLLNEWHTGTLDQLVSAARRLS